MPLSLHALLLEAAERAPEAPAIQWQDETVSYAGLVERVQALAFQWHAQGLKQGSPVALILPAGLEAVCALYAASWLGCPYAPIPPSWPAERIHYALDALGAQAWVCSERLSTALQDVESCWRAPKLTLRPSVGRESATSYPASTGGDSPAYVLFTSGTTGRPKGVVHTHESAIAFASWAAKAAELEPTDRVSGHASLSFDLSTFDVFSTASAAACLLPVPEPIRFRGALLSRFLVDNKVTVFYGVPSVWPTILKAAGPNPGFSLRTVLFAGEPFPPAHLRALMSLLPKARYLNLYGPTETNVVTWHEMTPGDVRAADEPPSIGNACPGVTLRLIDASGGEAQEGELVVESPTMMRGYLGQTTQQGGYHTGDRVRREEDGSLSFLGRMDRQVKVRGHRVELSAIEAACQAHPDVVQVVALLDEGRAPTPEIVAFVTPITVSPKSVLSTCRSRLPQAAVPAQIISVDSMPLTPNGKIDSKRLATGSRTS